MDPTLDHTLWLQTALCIAGSLVGFMLHLKWHPLRAHLSDAWGLITRMPWLLLMLATASLISEWLHPSATLASWTLNDLLSWRDLAPSLALRAAELYTQSLHALFPPWPIALLVPPLLSTMAWRLHRLPYRYSTRKQTDLEKALLALTVLIAWTWLIMEVSHLVRPLPEWLETARLTLRLLFSALALACSQIFLIRLLIIWQTPSDAADQSDASQALAQTFARWRGVYGLATLQLLWLIWAQHPESPHASPVTFNYTRAFLIEAMLVFAPLPIAMAAADPSSPLLFQGAQAMRILLRTWLPWFGLLITATVGLMLLLYTSATLRELAGVTTPLAKAFLPVHALVLATARSWLFLATAFLLIRHRSPSPPP